MPVDEYDVAGFSVGIADKPKMIDGSKLCVDALGILVLVIPLLNLLQQFCFFCPSLLGAKPPQSTSWQLSIRMDAPSLP